MARTGTDLVLWGIDAAREAGRGCGKGDVVRVDGPGGDAVSSGGRGVGRTGGAER